MATIVTYLLVALAASLLLDASVRPRAGRLRRAAGLLVHLLTVGAAFGLFLGLTGTAAVAALLATAVVALLTVASNAKYRMLGEPLVFSDLALLAAMVRHPRFYFTAVPLRQRWIAGIAAVIASGLLIREVSWSLPMHLAGAAIFAAAMLALWLMLRTLRGAMRTPDLEGDVRRFGLFCTLIVYWRRWRATPDPAPVSPLIRAPDAPEIVIVVQCESFADPVALTGDTALALPHLTAARAVAWQQGNLAVSGFGAYTMRTEYGVLFGRSEDALGFRRFDPFLSAHGEPSYALSARLDGAGYRGIFVHPHDLRFYGRDRLMPAVGFDMVVGDTAFADAPLHGRYLDDRTLGVAVANLALDGRGPTFLYTVTMENHGPWDEHRDAGSAGGLDSYLRHARSSDAMLGDLIARLAVDGRPALLVFFGDHRPSIPGVSMPGADRHTPYVMLRFGAGGIPLGRGERVDGTPADLHAAVLACVSGRAA